MIAYYRSTLQYTPSIQFSSTDILGNLVALPGKYDKQDFEDLHDYKEAEILMTNRFIKKEVIDMADLLEEMSEIIINQNRFLGQVAGNNE